MDRKIWGMTLRDLTGMGLLTALLVLGLLSGYLVCRQQDALAGQLGDSGRMALSGQWEEARETAEQARAAWERRWPLLAAVTDHGPMEEIDSLFRELTVYAGTGQQEEFTRVCALLAKKLRGLGDTHRLTWWNVL